jgi:hypothetical protein
MHMIVVHKFVYKVDGIVVHFLNQTIEVYFNPTII